MSPSELIELFESNPTTPFRLTLCSGDVVDVDNPRRTIFEGLAVYIGQSDDPDARLAQRVRLVSIPNIAMAEAIDRRHWPRRSRRR
jgi:hypothetical protein